MTERQDQRKKRDEELANHIRREIQFAVWANHMGDEILKAIAAGKEVAVK